ncbi:endonuclease domain-containing protein [Microlunatus antarcticus]
MTLQDEVRSVVEREGVIARKDHPDLAGAIAWLVRRGELAPVLPGVFCAHEVAGTFEARIRALACSDPGAVLTGATAARLSFWPKLTSAEVECATRWERAARPGFVFSRRRVPPDLVVERAGLRLTSPALTAIDLVATEGGDAIDHALRTRMTTLARMWSAFELTPGRPGNVDRRRMLLDSRDQPWSAAERLAHRLLRRARITGWKANLPVVLQGQRYYLDVAFPTARLVVEIDGRLHEDDPEVFENDRWRQNALILDGWMVLRFTWRMLEENPRRVIADVRAALASLQSAR